MAIRRIQRGLLEEYGSMIDVLMPQLGESVAEGTVTKWLVREGDTVKREQPLLEVATDKADTEVPSPSNGRVAQIAAQEGAVIPKGGLLCRIDETQTESAPGPSPSPGAASPATSPQGDGQNGSDEGSPQRPGASTLTSPSARRMALQTGVDLNQIQPTGERGRITRDDVMRAASTTPATQPAPSQRSAAGAQAQAQAVAPPGPLPPGATLPAAAELSQMIQAGGGFVPPIPGLGFGAYKVPPYTPRPGDEVVPFSRRRRITADHMVYSKLTSPHVVTVAEVDLYATSRLRDEHKERFKKEGVPLTFLAFICTAVVKALREYPQVNARVLENSFAILREINLGIAVDTPGGLIVPSIKHADQLSLRGIASTIDEVAGRARTGKITADDLAGTTFSVSNPGQKGNLFGAAIISQPNVGILRMGEIKKRVVVVTQAGEDSIAIHPVMFMALSYDHRIIDGVLANSFLWRVSEILSRGEFEI
jgi:2-oxoglutarate dehydrogenase E2 component (dihydrolipoamide succinyltransferase)